MSEKEFILTFGAGWTAARLIDGNWKLAAVDTVVVLLIAWVCRLVRA